ncbi:hypothetical protein Dimus_024984 [Dionaea muscipula]
MWRLILVGLGSRIRRGWLTAPMTVAAPATRWFGVGLCLAGGFDSSGDLDAFSDAIERSLLRSGWLGDSLMDSWCGWLVTWEGVAAVMSKCLGGIGGGYDGVGCRRRLLCSGRVVTSAGLNLAISDCVLTSSQGMVSTLTSDVKSSVEFGLQEVTGNTGENTAASCQGSDDHASIAMQGDSNEEHFASSSPYDDQMSGNGLFNTKSEASMQVVLFPSAFHGIIKM